MESGTRHLIDVVKYKYLWIALTVVLLLPGIIAMVYSTVKSPLHLPLNVGIDYLGGTVLQYGVKSDVEALALADIREKLKVAGIENPQLQIINVNSATDATKNIITVRTKFVSEDDKTTVDKVTATIQSAYKNSTLISINSIGPTFGKELLKNSLIALSLACLAIVIYLTIRFQLDFAIIAILATIHDVIFVLGAFSILGLMFNIQVDGLFLTAILTVIGFSTHDTIVVFDRLRENLRYYAKKMTFSELINLSVNQTLARSVNTSLTTLITLLALYFFGGVTTKDFVLAMILGIAIGTYSSIFFASILLDIWRERKTA